ncbi:MAG: FliM/FliN family flagellar motor C-terminal domain-containing protein, partial [Pseudomonadota bacterium]
DLLNMGENAVLTLDKRIEDPVDLYVGDQLVARGVLEEMEGEQPGQLAVRLTEISDLKHGIG